MPHSDNLTHTPTLCLIAVGAFLADVRPLLPAKNHLAYSAVMTPLIILIIDAGRAPDSSLLFDRLIATLIGAILVVAANLLVTKFSVSKGTL